MSISSKIYRICKKYATYAKSESEKQYGEYTLLTQTSFIIMSNKGRLPVSGKGTPHFADVAAACAAAVFQARGRGDPPGGRAGPGGC